jgi:hypothetical protein
MHRFYIVSERYGLVGVVDTQERADAIGLAAAVNTARTVYVHDRLEELSS